jgi:thioredoxin reductase (NADPH)
MIDVAIVGAGPCGLAAAIAADRAGLHAVTFDSSCIVSGIYGYPTDLIFFSTPEKLEIGGVPFVSAGERPTRQEGLAYYRSVASQFALELRQYETVERIERDGGGFTLHTRTLGGATHVQRAAAVVIATGYFGCPVRLGVPGEDRAHVLHFYREGHAAFDQDVIVVGGANSAVETALLLQRGGARVTIVHYHDALGTNVKPWVLPDITARIADGSIQTRFDSRVTNIEAEHAEIAGPHGPERLPARHVYLMVGFEPNTALLEQLGVPIDAESGIPQHDPATMETSVPGVFIAGVLTSGIKANSTFIENGRHHGELIAARLAHAHSH